MKTKLTKLEPLEGKPFKIEGNMVELPIDPELDAKYLVKFPPSVDHEQAQGVADSFRKLLGSDRVMCMMGDAEIYRLEDIQWKTW